MPASAEPKGNGNIKLWPFPVPAALLAVPLLWLVLGGALWVTHEVADWPRSDTAGGIVFLVAAAGLIPILLVVVDAIASQQGAITTKWFSVDFGKATVEQARPAVGIETGLGSQGAPITDSSVVAVHQTLNQARRNEIVRLDLGTGDKWWITRLFALCAGARTTGAPKALVFIGHDLGADGAFLGWIDAEDGFRMLRAHREPLRFAYDRAQAIARYVTTVAPVVAAADPIGPAAPAGHPELTVMAVPANNYAHPPFLQQGEDTALRVLLDLLGKYEQQQQQVAAGGVEWVTIGGLQDVFGDELHRETVDLGWPTERQLQAFLSITDDYVAAVENGRFARVIDRRSLLNALLRQVLLPTATSD